MLTVFTARTIITMNPSLPRAEAVAVRDGRIVEVGTLETLAPWLDAHPHELDERFQDACLLPGFIDPHLHPTMAAVILPMAFITALPWRLPWEDVPATEDPATFDARLAERLAAQPEGDPLIVWGYHQLWHGEMNRDRINAVCAERPIIVWHRSFHELYMNDAALAWLAIDAEAVGRRQQINLPAGHFFENGLGFAIARLNPYLLAPERYRLGLERLRAVVELGGHTTIGDMAVGLFDFDMEMEMTRAVLDKDDVPFRIEQIPTALGLLRKFRSQPAILEHIEGLPAGNSHRLRFARRVKLFADGAFFSQLAQLGPPGYIDGHHGEWLMTPEILEEAARVYWNAGYRIHLHVTGDLGLELGLEILEKLQWERPRFNHGFTFEHFGFSTPEQVHRIARLGANVSANVYYLHELGQSYAEGGIGYERASQMARLKSCFDAGICTAVHSDFTMAPAEPLNSAWVAANRENCTGRIMGEREKVSPYQALEAITCNAARVLGIDDEVGTIRAGKRADFTVLAEDPLSVGAERLRDIPVLGTVFEGRPHQRD